MWAEVLMGVEDRLGTPTPGIPDGAVFASKPLDELTLRDMAQLVAGYVPAGADANETAIRLVLESAEQVTGAPVSAADLDGRLLQALRVPHWTDKHAEPGTAPDRGGM